MRLLYSEIGAHKPLKVSTWDALGYYMYLPANYIYHDEKELKWFAAIDSTYDLSGGSLYQATRHANGHYVFKYLKGVSQLQWPFFMLAHYYALHSKYAADGFSLPYQYGIAFGCLFYCLLDLFLLRIILLKYFKDETTAITLFLLTIASNFIQYVAVDSGLSHGYIFPLYIVILYATIQWHEKPKLYWALLIGALIGLASTSRPTEAVMLFIPLLWNTQTRELRQAKIRFFRNHPLHLLFVMIGMWLAVLPQLLYWKRVTDSWIYDVGSKWDFLNPHFRVLFGAEKGWFIYTPVAILFIIGFFFMKKTPYRNAVIIFCLLNIYIIISWHIWRYGGSYSCRALVQSYPLFAFPLACFVEYILSTKGRIIFVLLFIYLSVVNLFQIKQYNEQIIHYDDMNFTYYKAIYLNATPNALDMSLLDEAPMMRNEDTYQSRILYTSDTALTLQANDTLWHTTLPQSLTGHQEVWIKWQITLQTTKGLWASYLKGMVMQEQVKETKIRLFHALAVEDNDNEYAFFVRITEPQKPAMVTLMLAGNEAYEGTLKHLKVIAFWK